MMKTHNSILYRFLIAVTLLLALTTCVKDGNPVSFTAPSVTLGSASSTQSSITLTATVSGEAKLIKEAGFIYGTDSGLSSSKKVTGAISGGTLTATITGLSANTKYYYKAYISGGRSEISSGSAEIMTKIQLPSVVTAEVTDVSTTTAASGGNVTSDGGSSVTARGVCWSTSENPTVDLSTKTTDGTGMGTFTSSITGLTAETTYYVRAYATNSKGTAYGEQKSFTTSATTTITTPTLTTTDISSITATSASTGGNITSDGGASVTARGVCWSTSENPTVDLSTKTTDGTGMGTFTSSITGLTAETTYYVRAYATNSKGTAYGEQKSFTTSATTTITTPTLTTTDISSITATSASTGGNITSDGGASVTARGVCWSTSENPTVDLSAKTTDGTGTGTFTSSITGLTAGTTYYVRAYATNSAGTSYGEQKSFKAEGATGGGEGSDEGDIYEW